MNTGTKRGLKILGGITGAIIIFVVVVIIFISPIAKYVIEKYDMQILGRKIRLSWIYVNPFTGNVHISNLKIYEHSSDSLFFTANGITVNFAMFKLIHKTYEIENLTLTKPWANIIQNRTEFNFDDILTHFSPKDTLPEKAPSAPVHFNILDVAIKDGEFHYLAQSIPASYYIKNVNIETPGKRWDADSMAFRFSLTSGPSTGDINGNFSINFDTLNYSAAVKVINFDLSFLDQYLQDIAEYGNFTAVLDADVQAEGNLGKKMAVAAKGQVDVSKFHFGKVEGEDYASFDKLAIHILDARPMDFRYNIDTIMLNHPFFKYERYDYLDNLQQMFGKGGSTYTTAKADSTKPNLIILIANYVQDLAKNFSQSYYRVNKVAIYNGDIRYNDYAIREKFAASANPLTVIADTIDKNKDRMSITLRSGIKPFGSVYASISLDPNDYGFFDLKYGLGKIPLAIANPYLITYTSFPLDRGTLEFNGTMQVEDSVVKSDNHLLIVDPRTSKRLKKKDTRWIPLPFILSIVREAGGGIEYQIPIRGSLKDPKFKFRYVIADVLKNIFVKPPSTPYLVHVIDVQKEVEKYFTLKWPTRQSVFTVGQQNFTDRLASFLKETPGAVIHVTPITYTEKEKEYILFFEAKKKYFMQVNKLTANTFTEQDSVKVDKMSVKDSVFVRYINKHLPDSMMFTIQEKCTAFLGNKTVDIKYAELQKAREAEFMDVFAQSGVQAQVKMNPAEAGVPYNGFSIYKINYTGDVPDKLTKVYDEISDLNENRPRVKFKKERTKLNPVLGGNQLIGKPTDK